MPNKTKKDTEKGFLKRVLHISLPIATWEKFETYRKQRGFTTRAEAIRHLIRTAG